ncbi:MAG: S1C family serine protease, partial [Planctomycetota bacterium]
MTRFSPIRCEQMWPFDSASLTGPIRFGLGLLFCVLFSGIAYSDSPEEASSVAEASRFSPTVRMLRRVRPAIVAILVQRDGKLHSGSGSIIHPAGLVLTNHHVVQGNSGFVLIDGDTVVPFRPIGSDPERDLAVIQIKVPKGKSLTAIDLGTSGNTEMGEEIVNLGNPGGRGVIATRGIISAPNIRAGGLAVAMANNKLDELDRFIQFDAASNPGNSGGAIVNVLGQQIGVVASQIKGEENGNLAIPIDRFHQLLHEMMSVEILRGIQVGLRVKESDGEVDIEAVAKGSPAAAVGLRPGMTIQSWNGKPIRSHIEFQLALLQMDAKKSFEVSVVDDGKTRRFSLSPMVVPPEPPT